MKALILVNDGAGTVANEGAERLNEILRESSRTAGWTAETEMGDAPSLIERAKAAKGFDAIVSAGGDGTHAAIASALLDRDIPLLPLPCGTVNLFCRDMGLSRSPAEALQAGLSATPRRVDAGVVEIAEIGPRVFLNNIVFGAFADLAEAREELRRMQGLEDASFAIAEASAAILNAQSVEYSINLDGAERGFSTNTLVVSNNPFTEAAEFVPRRARIDAGALAVYLVEADGFLGFTRSLLDFLTGEGAASTPCYAAERCAIADKAGATRFAIDGEPFESEAPVVMSVAAGALRVLAPETA